MKLTYNEIQVMIGLINEAEKSMRLTKLERRIKERLNNYCNDNREEDRLQEMFDKQKVMQKRLRGDELPCRMPDRYPREVTSIIAELGELLEEDQAWKDWKKNPKPPTDNLKVEVADLWHFFINLTLYMGFDASDVYEFFTSKNKINHQRQEENY